MAGSISLAEYSYSISVESNGVEQSFKRIQKEADTSASGILKSFNNASDDMKKKLESLNKVSEGFSKVGSTMLKGITLPIVGLGTLCTNAASNLKQTQQRTQVIFGDMAKDVQKWALENERNFGLGSGTIENYVGQIADLTQGLGMSKEASYDMAKGATELGIQLGNWGGYKTEEVINDLNKAMTGSYEGLTKYGIKLNETALNEQTRAMGLGDTYSELDNVAKAQVIYEASMKASQNAIDYWNDGQRSTSFYLTEIKEQLGNVAENIGAVLLPKVLEITKKIGDLTAKFAQWTAENPEMVEQIVHFAGVLAMVGPALLGIGKGIKIFTTVKSAISGLSAVAGVFGTTLGGLLLPIGAIIAGVALLAVAWKNDFGGIQEKTREVMGSIKSIIDSILTFVEGLWESNFLGIQDIVSLAWQNIQLIFSTALEIISGIFKVFSQLLKGDFSGAMETIKSVASTVWENIKQVFSNALNGIVILVKNIGSSLYSAGSWAMEKLKEALSNIWNSIISWFSGAINSIVNTVKNIGSSLYSAGASIFNSLWSGIKSIWSNISSWVSDKVSWIADKLTFWNNSKSAMNSSNVGSKNGRSTINLPQYAVGTNLLNSNQLALVHQGEAIIPKASNPFNSDTMAKQIANQINGSMDNVSILKALNSIANILENNNSSLENVTIESKVILDGKEIAIATVPYMDKELNKYNKLRRR